MSGYDSVAELLGEPQCSHLARNDIGSIHGLDQSSHRARSQPIVGVEEQQVRPGGQTGPEVASCRRTAG